MNRYEQILDWLEYYRDVAGREWANPAERARCRDRIAYYEFEISDPVKVQRFKNTPAVEAHYEGQVIRANFEGHE